MAAKPIAVLKLSNKVKTLITYAQSVAQAMAANATSFPSPTPTLAVLQADIAALVTAETAVWRGRRGRSRSATRSSRPSKATSRASRRTCRTSPTPPTRRARRR